MKNKDLWVQKYFLKDSRGRVKGSHMHKLIGPAYEKVIRQHSTGLLADVGCGDVPYYFIYKDIVEDNICIDWGREDGDVSFLDVVADLNNPIPLQSEIADTILCTDVFEHIHNPELLFSEITRLMKKEAKLILTVPFLYWIHDAPHDHHRYTRYKLVNFCEKNNLKIISLEEYGGWPEVVYDMVHKGFYYYNLPFKKLFLFLWRTTGNFLYKLRKVKSLSKKTQDVFPLGYILVAQK